MHTRNTFCIFFVFVFFLCLLDLKTERESGRGKPIRSSDNTLSVLGMSTEAEACIIIHISFKDDPEGDSHIFIKISLAGYGMLGARPTSAPISVLGMRPRVEAHIVDYCYWDASQD